MVAKVLTQPLPLPTHISTISRDEDLFRLCQDYPISWGKSIPRSEYEPRWMVK